MSGKVILVILHGMGGIIFPGGMISPEWSQGGCTQTRCAHVHDVHDGLETDEFILHETGTPFGESM